jgi:hypothetical protein
VLQISKRGVSKPAVHAVSGGVETAGWRVRLPEDARRLQIETIHEP